MLFEDKLHDIIDTLEADKMLLLPIGFAWAVVYRDLHTLLEQWSQDQYHLLDSYIFMLVLDLPALKSHQPQLHPRVETLLHYHRRPLGIVSDEYDGKLVRQFEVAHCIAFDPFAHRIVQLLGSPICCSYISYQGRLVRDYCNITASVSRKASYIANRHRSQTLSGIRPKVAKYDYHGNLIFAEAE